MANAKDTLLLGVPSRGEAAAALHRSRGAPQASPAPVAIANTARISVIICSLEPRPHHFTRLLASLAAQTLPRELWQLLLVDNASATALSETWDLSWHPQHVHVRETEVGLTPARLRGIATASSELLIFFDDDNVVAPDYLAQALAIGDAHPFLDVFGAGTIEPEFEVAPRPHVRPFLAYLALRTVPLTLWTNNARDVTCVPWGLGLCVRRASATAYVGLVAHLPIAHMLDRRGKQLFAGGDDLFSWLSAASGSGFGVFPQLRLIHLMPACRLEDSYLIQLIHDHAYSHTVLKHVLWDERRTRSTFEMVIRIVLNGIRRGIFSMRCKWAALCGTVKAERDIAVQDLRPLAPGSQWIQRARP